MSGFMLWNKVRNVAVTVAAAGAVGAFVPAPAGADVWDYVAAYPLTTAGYNKCMVDGKQWQGSWRCRKLTGEHWSHKKSDYHLEILK
ncbi:hypothetical protein [Nonomuraea angiospora]|uniref:hypothetical protein n=1 Tax=Nonomuraea TaxID=83681 RepID=UPI0033315299